MAAANFLGDELGEGVDESGSVNMMGGEPRITRTEEAGVLGNSVAIIISRILAVW